MSRYIDAEIAIEYVKNILVVHRYYHPRSKTENFPIGEVIDKIEQVPTVDAVPVVRCNENDKLVRMSDVIVIIENQCIDGNMWGDDDDDLTLIDASKTIDDLSDIPTVDAVTVVRCKDCKYAHLTYDDEAKYCDQWETDDALYLDGDFYCAFGEKKVTE